MIVVSPWSKGGWVCSEVFDHTSLIRFLEQRFAPRHPGLIETNITAWRRAVCGDLTSAFDFATPNAARVALPDTAAYAPRDRDRHPDYVPVPPANQALPSQEPGLRRARALPYDLEVSGKADLAAGTLRLDFANTGEAGACFQIRSGDAKEGPWTFTVEAGDSLSGSWKIGPANQGRYDLSVFGPNGFLRTVKGTGSRKAPINLVVESRYDVARYQLVLRVTNRGSDTSLAVREEPQTGQRLQCVLEKGDEFGCDAHHALLAPLGPWPAIRAADRDAASGEIDICLEQAAQLALPQSGEDRCGEDRSLFGRERGEERDHLFRSQDVVVGIGHLPWLHELSRVVAEPLVRLARLVEGSNDEPPGCG